MLSGARYMIVNYESQNFSISQALSSNDAQRQIVPIQHVETQTTSASPTASPTSTGSSTLPPITMTTSHPSHSLGTPAIAGIVVGIVFSVMIVCGIGVWLIRKRKREPKRQNSRDSNTAELAGSQPFKAELDNEGSRQINDQKGPRTSMEEVSEEKQTQMDQREINIMDNGIHGNPLEMSGPEVPRSELPSPDPFIGHELSSNEAELMRSELSTPEPGCAAEMPSPDMVPAEMPSPEIGAPAAGEGSPSPGVSPSPLPSPHLEHPSRPILSRRPVPSSMESSRQRLQLTRRDSTDSESPYPSATMRSIRPTPAHMRGDSSDSEALTLLPRNSLSRPTHHRLDSKDSSDTFETRLEQSSPGSRLARDRPTEGMPSLANQSSQEALVSPSAASLRSGLRSPEPLERGLREEDEDKASDSEARRRE